MSPARPATTTAEPTATAEAAETSASAASKTAAESPSATPAAATSWHRGKNRPQTTAASRRPASSLLSPRKVRQERQKEKENEEIHEWRKPAIVAAVRALYWLGRCE